MPGVTLGDIGQFTLHIRIHPEQALTEVYQVLRPWVLGPQRTTDLLFLTTSAYLLGICYPNLPMSLRMVDTCNRHTLRLVTAG